MHSQLHRPVRPEKMAPATASTGSEGRRSTGSGQKGPLQQVGSNFGTHARPVQQQGMAAGQVVQRLGTPFAYEKGTLPSGKQAQQVAEVQQAVQDALQAAKNDQKLEKARLDAAVTAEMAKYELQVQTLKADHFRQRLDKGWVKRDIRGVITLDNLVNGLSKGAPWPDGLTPAVLEVIQRAEKERKYLAKVDKDRRDWLQKNYSDPLRKNGRPGTVVTLALNKLNQNQLTRGVQFLGRATDSVRTVKWKGYTLGKVSFGSAAFVKKVDAAKSGLARDIWVKRGTENQSGAKEYVKDDMGVVTRRFAYAEKAAHQIKDLQTGGVLKGRYMKGKSDLNDALTPSAYVKSEFGIDRKLTAEEMLYLHQEKGSGDEQRGVSISSTPKMIFGNSGDRFRSIGGRTLKIDLAHIPKATNPDVPNLVNFYAQDSRAQTENWARSFGTKDYPNPSPTHFQNSVTKNRELFLRELPINALHSWSKPHTESDVYTNQTGKVSYPQVDPRTFELPSRGGSARPVTGPSLASMIGLSDSVLTAAKERLKPPAPVKQEPIKEEPVKEAVKEESALTESGSPPIQVNLTPTEDTERPIKVELKPTQPEEATTEKTDTL